MTSIVEPAFDVTSLLNTCCKSEIAKCEPDEKEKLEQCLDEFVQSVKKHLRNIPAQVTTGKLLEPIDRSLAEEVVALDATADELSAQIALKREKVPESVEQSIAAQLKAIEDSVLGEVEAATKDLTPIVNAQSLELDVGQMESLRRKFAEISERVNKFAEVVPTAMQDAESAVESASTVLQMPSTTIDKAIAAGNTEENESGQGSIADGRSDGTVLAKRLARKLGKVTDSGSYSDEALKKTKTT